MRCLALLLAGGVCFDSPFARASTASQPLAEQLRSAQWIVAAKPGASNEKEAAKLATRQYGGKVLRVQRQGNHFEVRLLLDNGRVKHVNIAASNGSG